MALKQIKNKIVSTKKTGKVTKAMEAVSAVKMRKSQERAFLSRPYIYSAMKILARLASSEEGLRHPLAKATDGKKVLMVIVTSDKGLAGSVNSAVLKKCDLLQDSLVSRAQGEGKVMIMDYITLGRKATEYVARKSGKLLASYTNIADGVSLADVADIQAKIIEAYNTGEYSAVKVVYQNFISTFEQAPTDRQILPLDPAEIHFIRQGIAPVKGKFSQEAEVLGSGNINYTVEPSVEAVLDTLIPQLIQIMLFHALIESKACEHSARMVAMKNATDKSKEVARSLTLSYNKARQAAITAEVAEITGGMEAMK